MVRRAIKRASGNPTILPMTRRGTDPSRRIEVDVPPSCTDRILAIEVYGPRSGATPFARPDRAIFTLDDGSKLVLSFESAPDPAIPAAPAAQASTVV